MNDKEFYERVSILIDNFSSQLAHIVLQDYENLNLVSRELSSRKLAAGGRTIKTLGKRYKPETTA